MENLRDVIIWLLRQGKETEWLEFKENYHSPEELGETIAALSNGACLHQQPFGYIIFGVSDNIEIIGTTFDPSRIKKGNEPIENWILQRLSPKIDLKFLSDTINGKRVLMIEISAARDQPVTFSNESYIRIGSITRKLRDFPDKQRKIWNNRPDESFVKDIAMSNLHEQDIIDRLDTQGIFEMLKVPYPSTRTEVIARLEQEQFIVKKQAWYAILNLGALLFAKNMSTLPTVERKAPRLIVYEGKNKLKTQRDTMGRLGYASAFVNLVDYIYAQLPANEEISKVIRDTVNMYPKDAIRELVANALVHQDFAEFGMGPLIEIYSDRIEITNPGIPLIPPLRFIDGYKSRNEKLATLMRRLGICEEKGSGLDRVVALAEFYQLPAPDFTVTENQTKVILYAHKKMSEMDRNDKIRACYQHCCLRYISNERMTNQTLRERFKIDSQNAAIASRIIGDTLEAGLIKPEDPENKSRKHIRYVPDWA